MVNGLFDLKEPNHICSECVILKYPKDVIPKYLSYIANNMLELIQPNIFQPINPASNGGNMYFITFIDDSSRKIWTLPLHKNQVNLMPLRDTRP